jgi:hypothetical protein
LGIGRAKVLSSRPYSEVRKHYLIALTKQRQVLKSVMLALNPKGLKQGKTKLVNEGKQQPVRML